MSRLQELIERYCPDGVEYRALGELGAFTRGSSFQKKHFVKDGVPCIHYGQVHTQFDLSADHVVSYLDSAFAAKMKRAKPGDLIIATTSEDDAAVGKAIAWMGDTDVVVSNDAYIYRHQLDPLYMAYIFASDLYQQPKLKYVTGTKVRRVHEKGISKIRIPVPPIEVQREIVRLLDAYTAAHDALIDRLNEEIELQAKSLAAYRESLLTFAERERVRWATLGDVCNVGRGTYITGKEVIPGDVPVILGGKEPAYYHNASNHEGEAIVVSRSGVNAGYASYWNQSIFVSDGFVIDAPKADIKLLYIFRYLEMKRPELIAMNRGSGVPHITGKMLKNVLVPVPNIDVQVGIVNELDGAACTYGRLTDALYKEVELRETQLAEFRNQLLTFPEKAA